MKKLIFILFLSFASCHQGVKEKNIPKTKVQEIEKFQEKADKTETNKKNTKFGSVLRSNELVLFNEIYTDTIEFSDYNDDFDYWYLKGIKNGKDVSLVYNWDWRANQDYNFRRGDLIIVHWKMDSLVSAGDEEVVNVVERAIDAKKTDLTEDEISMNPDAVENIDPQKFVLALKDHILNEWQKQDDFDTLKITFGDNILNIRGNEGFTLSYYDFNKMVINGTNEPQKIYLTVTNEGGGSGGNVVVEETYSLTVLDAENFEIRSVKSQLID